MQVGFAFIQSGAIRYKGAQAITLNVLKNVTFGFLFWWLVSNFKFKF
jgi:hypothetical protein